MKSESFRKQALSLVLFFAAIAAVFALTRLRSDPAKKQAEFVVQQLLSCSSAVEQAVDAAAPAGSEPGLVAVDTDGLYAFLQAQLGDAMTADCLDKVMANRLPTRITALAGQSGGKLTPADLTLKKARRGRKLLRLFRRPADRHGQHRRRAGIRHHHHGEGGRPLEGLCHHAEPVTSFFAPVPCGTGGIFCL